MTQVAYRLVRRPPADARRELTGEQRRVVEHSGGPLLVLGGAGTGKTFTLVESAARRLEAGAQSVAVVVHAAAAAARLREALAARVPGLAGRVRAVTWAGLAVAAVADAAGRPEVVGAAEAGRKLAELARGQAPGSWPEPWESLRHLPRFAREAGRALDWLRREGVGPELVVAAGEAQTRPEWAALGRLGREYDEVLALEGRTDFGGLFGLAAAAGAGPGVAAEAWFVDSFEEAEPAHLRLLAALAGPGANVVAFADPRQVTGQFRGASPRVAAQFADLFPGAGVAQLTRSWRQGGELAAATAAVAGRIGVAAPDVTAGGEPGTATAVVLTGQAGEAAWIAAELRRAHLAGLAWEQMAVIVRAGHRVPALAEALTAQGVPVAAGWTDVPLADEPVVADLVALAGSEEPRPGDRRSVAERLWAVWQASDWPQRLAEGLAGPARDRLVAGRDLDAACALFARAEAQPELAGLMGWLAFTDDLRAEPVPAGRARLQFDRPGVGLMTVHRAKGREWDLVVVAGAEEGLWPGFHGPAGLFDLAGLTPDGRFSPPSWQEQLQAERSLFYAACSRARRRLVVTAAESPDGETAASRFLAELGVPVRPASLPPAGPTSLEGLAALLRLRAVDPAAPPALRACAAARLARLADKSPAADPATWWGVDPVGPVAPALPPDEIRLSGSSLEGLLDCPRRWFLSRRAHADPPPSPAARLGVLLHELAEGLGLGELTRDRAGAILAERWDELGFASAWQSAAQRREAETALDRLAAWLAARPAGGAFERGFSVPAEAGGYPIRLQGRFDRLEPAADGAWRIVDFKTGKRPPTAAQALAHLQLGLYQLALAQMLPGGPEAVAGAELVYLKVDDHGRPKTWSQPPLAAAPYLSRPPRYAGLGPVAAAAVGDQAGYPTWVHHALAWAAAIIREGVYPAVGGQACRNCAFKAGCPVHAQDQEGES